MNIAARLSELVRQDPSAPAVRFLGRGEVITYSKNRSQLEGAALELARGFASLSMVHARVLLALPAGPDFTEALLGCFYAGVVAVPIPLPQHRRLRHRLERIAADCAAIAVVCRAADSELLAAHFAAADATTPLLLTVEEVRCRGQSAGQQLKHAAPDDLALIQYTSGSTREPRGVVLTHRQVLANAQMARRAWHGEPNDVYLNWVPHYHDLGLGSILFPLLWGATSLQMATFAFLQKPTRLLRAIAEHGATICGGPPFAYDLLLRTVDAAVVRDYDLTRWRLAFCGAEPVPATLLARFRARFCGAGLRAGGVFVVYGMAESVAFVAGGPFPAEVPEPAGAGVAPCYLCPEDRARIRVVDPSTCRPVQGDASGEIWLSSPAVGAGFFGQIDASASTFRARLVPDDGRAYLRTGDIGYLAGDCLYITGRSKDIFIVNGANVAASDIEWLAGDQDPALNPLAAAAVELGEPASAVLMIEVKEELDAVTDRHGLANLIRVRVRHEYGVSLRAVHIVERGTLPRTTSGKVRRSCVRAQLIGGYAAERQLANGGFERRPHAGS